MYMNNILLQWIMTHTWLKYSILKSTITSLTKVFKIICIIYCSMFWPLSHCRVIYTQIRFSNVWNGKNAFQEILLKIYHWIDQWLVTNCHWKGTWSKLFSSIYRIVVCYRTQNTAICLLFVFCFLHRQRRESRVVPPRNDI